MRISVVGLGKIGLPLAVQYADRGHEVVGADINPATVDLVNSGTEPFPGEAHLAERLAVAVGIGRLRATTDTAAAVATSDAVVIVVPLFVDNYGTPDFALMDAATRSVAAGLTPGTLVSYETTLPVGTTRDRYLPLLSQVSGLCCPDDFWLVFSPERVLTGRVFADLARYPKLVGGVDSASTARGIEFYRDVLTFDERADLDRPNGVWDMGTSEAAELAKLAETTYRDVNIGLANQFARFSADHGIDIHSVIDACNSQPYSHIHRPGIAVGGHCIPVYPRLYLWNDPDATIVHAARQANLAMPAYAVRTLAAAHGPLHGQDVVVLGAAYRGGVKETAFSGTFDTVAALATAGAHVTVHDPMFSDDELTALGFQPHGTGVPVDAAILQADHDSYRRLTPADLPGIRTIIDGRRLLKANDWPGVCLVTLGVG